MANYLVVLCVVALSFQACFAKPAESQLSTLSQNVQKAADDLKKELGLQDVTIEKIGKTITDQSKALADNLQLAVNKLKTEFSAHQPEVESVVKNVEAQLTKTAEDLKKNIDPKTQKQFEDARQKLEDGAKTAATEFDKLVKSITQNQQVQEAQENIQNTLKGALESVLNALKNSESQIKKAVADHEKTHKQ